MWQGEKDWALQKVNLELNPFLLFNSCVILDNSLNLSENKKTDRDVGKIRDSM